MQQLQMRLLWRAEPPRVPNNHQQHHHHPLDKQAAILRRRRRLWIALIAFSSSMAVSTLTGFVYVFYEMNSSVFASHGTISGTLNESRNRNRKRRPTISSHIFSDQEANSNSEKLNTLREHYNSHCLCEKRDCRLFVDQQWTLPEVPSNASLYTIQSNMTAVNANTKETQKSSTDSILDDEQFWKNESFIAKCPYVIMDLGSNRGDTVQAFLNAMLSSLYSPSSLSPFHASGCNSNNTKQQWTTKSTPSYQFDLPSTSIKPRTSAELSKRYNRVYKKHQLDMEAYLDLHMGRVYGEQGDPWMEFQLKDRMEQQQNNDREGKARQNDAMRKIYEEQIMRNNKFSEQSRPRPEQYCFYGVEGNPAFTRKLRGLEAIIMGIIQSSSGSGSGEDHGHPQTSADFKGIRLLRHIHFFTSTVATSHNGSTELYLDSVSTDHVGSSLLDSHKYAHMKGGEKVEVQGRTLDWLLEHVLDGFGTTTDVTAEKSSDGGHLILKIDIEGSEYSVLKEAIESGMLCDYAKKGNRVDLVVEFHKWVIEDKKASNYYGKKDCAYYDPYSLILTCVCFLTPTIHKSKKKNSQKWIEYSTLNSVPAQFI